MRTIEAYESVDGSLHITEKAAKDRDDDCIGQEIDSLLTPAVAACNGNVTRNDQYRMALHLLNDRTRLAAIVATLDKYLNSSQL